jgi:PAS domain S-box-containing protein
MDRISPGIVIAIILIFLVIILAGIFFYHTEEQLTKNQITGDLMSITVLKTDQIVAWREERLGDAAVISQDRLLMDSVNSYLGSADPADREKILALFTQINSSYHYRNVILTDQTGRVRLSIDPAVTTLSPGLADQLRTSLVSHKAELTDLMPDPDPSSPRMYVIAPLYGTENDTGPDTGAIIMVIDPHTFLFPLIQSWPVQSDSAETLLVEREDNHVLYLNDLRHRNNTALNLTIPLTNTNVPAVMAILGKTGPFEGTDYRGVDVVSVIEPVRGSPWFIVAKVDTAEVYAPWASRAILIIALVLVSLGVFLTALWMFWQRRQKYYYRSLLTTEQELAESERKYRNLYQYAQVGLFETSLKDATVIACNQRYADLAGFSSAEDATGKDILGLYVNPDDRMQAGRILRDAGHIENHTIKLRNRSTGMIFWAQFSARYNKERDVAEGTIIDVTALKEAEHALDESEQLYRSLFEHMLNGFAYCRMIYENGEPVDFTYIAVNEAFGKLTGLHDVEGKNVSAVIPGIREADPLLFAMYNRVAMTGIPEQQEMYVGALSMWFALSVYSPRRGDFVAVFDVITERKQVEEALRESRAKLDAALASMTDAVFISDNEGRFIDFNDAFVTFHRFRSRDECARTLAEYPAFLEVYMPDGELAPLDMWAVPRALRGETVTNAEYTLRRKDTGETWVGSYSFSPIHDKDGKIVGSVVSGRDITDLKKAEDYRHTLLQRFYLILSSMPYGTLLVTDEGRVEFVNQAFCDMFGLEDSPAGLSGMPADELMRKIRPAYADPDAELARVRDIVSRGQSVAGEDILMSGGRIFLRDFISIRLGEKQYGRLWNHIDITVRKRAEEEQARLASIVESSDEAIIGKTLDGTITSWNAGAERTYGYTAQEIIGKNISLLVPPAHPDDTETILEHIRHGEPVIRYETVRRKKDGEPIDVILTVSPVRDALNRITGASTIAHDISDRKRAEAKIKLSEMRYRRLFESAKDGILILNRETGEIVDANPFIESLLGYTPAELLGKYLWDIGTFRDMFASRAAFAELQGKKYIRYEDLPLETRDGLKIEVEFISNVYATGQTSVIQCNIRDITDRKILERQREALIRELEQKNAELERFTYTVSHDLKSPLITIKGFAGLLEGDVDSSNQLQLKKDILRITEAADIMQGMLTDLLELSRIGRIAKSPEKTGFGTITREAVDLLAGPLAERNVRIVIAPDLPVVNVDRARIRDVMINLIENAVKFMGDQQKPEIRIGVDMTGKMPVFFVQDNGIGINPRYLDRIFNLFERLDTATHGTGIGLTIARRIIEVHGGKIWAESEGVGKGTTFRFTLPGVPDKGSDNL